MKNTKENKTALLNKLKGKNGLAVKFCIFPYSHQVVDTLLSDKNPFVRPYEANGKKFLIAIDAPLRHCYRAIGAAGMQSFIFVRIEEDCIVSELHVKQITSVKNEMSSANGATIEKNMTTFYESIDNSSIRVKGRMYDISIPLSVYLDCANDIDEFVEIRMKTFHSDIECLKNDFLSFTADYAGGMCIYYGKGFLIGTYKTKYWKIIENQANNVTTN